MQPDLRAYWKMYAGNAGRLAHHELDLGIRPSRHRQSQIDLIEPRVVGRDAGVQNSAWVHGHAIQENLQIRARCERRRLGGDLEIVRGRKEQHGCAEAGGIKHNDIPRMRERRWRKYSPVH